VLTVAVLAGGLGTRLRPVTGDALPKALVPVAGRPFVEWKLLELREQGAGRVVMLVGHGADLIREHVGDGSALGLSVTYVDDGSAPLGTGGAVVRALPALGDAFWVAYGDTLLTVDVATAEHQFAASGSLALMTVLHNRDQLEPSNARVEGTSVVAYAKDPRPHGAQHIDYGMLLFRREAFAPREEGAPFDLGDVLQDLATAGSLDAFEVHERFHDIGTVASLRETEAYVRQREAG
jgi:NDP-sugar pyrophosphorylase family protein